MKLFFIYCLAAVASVGFLTFYRDPDAWHGLVFGICFYVLAAYIAHHKESK